MPSERSERPLRGALGCAAPPTTNADADRAFGRSALLARELGRDMDLKLGFTYKGYVAFRKREKSPWLCGFARDRGATAIPGVFATAIPVSIATAIPVLATAIPVYRHCYPGGAPLLSRPLSAPLTDLTSLAFPGSLRPRTATAIPVVSV